MANIGGGLKTRELKSRLVYSGTNHYDLDGLYVIIKVKDSWRWHRVENASIGGEWRRRLRDALDDLADYLKEHP